MSEWADFSSNNPVPDLGSYKAPLIGIKATEGTGYAWAGGDALAVERPAPAEIIRQVAAGHAAKNREPDTHPAVVRVDVLDVQHG